MGMHSGAHHLRASPWRALVPRHALGLLFCNKCRLHRCHVVRRVRSCSPLHAQCAWCGSQRCACGQVACQGG